MRPSHCIDCNTKLPIYRSNNTKRCSVCAKERIRVMGNAWKATAKMKPCIRCKGVKNGTQCRDLCNACYHIMNYVPTPRAKIPKKRVDAKKVTKGATLTCANNECENQFEKVGNRKFCSDECRVHMTKQVRTPEKVSTISSEFLVRGLK